MMTLELKKPEKKKLALTEHTYEKLKHFSRFNAVKMRLVIDAMTDVILQDAELSKRVIELALEKDYERE